MFRADSYETALGDRLDCSQNLWHEGLEMLHSIAWCPHNNNANLKIAQILLKLDSLIGRDKDVKSVLGGELEQLAVAGTAPAFSLNRR